MDEDVTLSITRLLGLSTPERLVTRRTLDFYHSGKKQIELQPDSNHPYFSECKDLKILVDKVAIFATQNDLKQAHVVS